MTVIENLPDIRPSLLLDFANSGRVDPRIQCTRASSATCYGPDGKLRTVAANVPRIDYDPVTGKCLGLLMEGARANSFRGSKALTNNWAVYGVTANPSDDQVHLIEDVSTGEHVSSSDVSFGAGTISYSIDAQRAGRDIAMSISDLVTGGARANFNLTTGTASIVGAGSGWSNASAGIRNLGGGWFRCCLTATATAGTAKRAYVYLTNGFAATYSGDGASGVYLRNSQFEEGAFPTSYIPTGSSAVSRAADAIQMPLGDWFNPNEGTFVVEYELSRNGASACVIDLHKSINPTSDRIGMRYASDGHAQYQVSVGGSQMSIAPLGANAPGRYRRSISYKVGEFLQAVNGVVSSPQVGVGIPDVDRFLIGSETVSGSNALNDTIKSIAYYPRAFTAVQHQRATAL